MKQFERSIDSREYIHDTCGLTTQVGGDDFLSLCDPRYPVAQTFCSHCDIHDALSHFQWADTNESLIEYRAKLATLVPLWAKIASSSWIFGVWIMLAALTGFGLLQLVPNYKIAFGVPAVVFFLIAAGFDAAGKFLSPPIQFHQYH